MQHKADLASQGPSTAVVTREGPVNNQDESKKEYSAQNERLKYAGDTLIDLASRDSADGRRKIFDYEMNIIRESFAVGQGSPEFTTYHVQAIRSALKHDNYDLVKALLDKDPTHHLLENESDILQAALSAECSWYFRWREESDSLRERIELLMTYGASINTLDSENNTPLYYTCTHGHHKTFRFLIDSGADYQTFHARLPNCDIDSRSTPIPSLDLDQVNLLQVALDARLEGEKGSSIPSIWTKPLQRKWGDIIGFFIDAGLNVRTDDPSLVKFLHIACFQGNLVYVEKLLSHGVDLAGRAGRSDDRDYIFGSPLHAAAAGGHKNTMLRLLQTGLKPSAPCRQTYFGEEELLTPIATAFKSYGMSMPQLKSAEVFDTCEALVEAGASEDDCKILMEECAKRGNVDMLKRLLQLGVRIQNVPLCRNLDAVRLLLESGASIEPARFQNYAAKQGSVDLLKFLVEKYGPSLQVEQDMGYITFDVIRGNHMAMLRYLGSEYLDDINTTFWQYPSATNAEYRVNLLQLACHELHIGAVRLLLDEGANPGCPGLLRTAAEFMREQLRSVSTGGTNTKDIQIFQLLVEHSNGRGSDKDFNANELSLMPTQLTENVCHGTSKLQKRPTATNQPATKSESGSDDDTCYEDDRARACDMDSDNQSKV